MLEMISKLVFIGLLASVSLAAGLPTKTAQREESLTATKGERQLASPIEYQRRPQALLEQQQELSKSRLDEEQKRSELSKTTEQHRDEQVLAREPAEQKREEATQIREDAGLHQQRLEDSSLTQQKEELPLAPTKTQNFYEAKPQIREETPLKEEQQTIKTNEQVKLVAQPKFELPKLEQQKIEETKSVKEQQRQEALPRDVSLVSEQQRESQFEQQQQFGQQVELSKDYEQQRLEEQQAPLVQQQQLLQEFDEQRPLGIKGEAPIPEKEPYAFDYAVEGSSRRESGDSRGVVRGQYTISGPDGSRRIVDYIADRDGFRASVQTNEFGTESRGAANVNLQSSQPAAEEISLRLEGKTREFLNPPTAVKGQAPLIEQLPAKPENWQVKGQAPLIEQLPAKPENWQVKGQAPILERLPSKTEDWQVKTQSQLTEQLPAKNQNWDIKGHAQLPTKSENTNWSAKGHTQLIETPAKEISQLEELPSAGKGELQKASEQERADVVKSAELRKPKSLDIYSSGRVSATAHRPVAHSPPADHIVSVRRPHHHHSPPLATVRHYATRSHHVPLTATRGVYREAPLVHYQHQPVIAPASRVVSHVHGQTLRSHSNPHLAPYSILSEEEAPIGFEAARS